MAAAPQTQTYSAAGSYSFTVPLGVDSVYVTAIGAAGGNCAFANGGEGASVSASFSVTAGETLFIGVGGAGGSGDRNICPDTASPGAGGAGGGASGGPGNGGGADSGAGGGGASLVGQGSSPTISDVLVVAGGGGGSSYEADGGNAGDGGSDGGTANTGGGPGTQSEGGAGGTADGYNATAGSVGTPLTGGAGGAGDTTQASLSFGGGGGGGGYYGGGGGGGGVGPSGGGGGGASFTAATDTDVSGPTLTRGQPEVVLTYGSAPTALASPTSGGTYLMGQVVPTSFSCAEGTGSPGLSSCDDSDSRSTETGGTGHLDTSSGGPHTYTVTATSTDGLTSTTSITYTVIGPPTPQLASPASGGTYPVGQVVATNFSCAEATGGTGLSSCDDSTATSTASGGTGHLNTTSVGAHTYTVTATSTDGLAGTTSISYTVIGPPIALLASPTSGGTYLTGQVVATGFGCVEATGGRGLSSCDDSNGTSTASGGPGHLNTTSAGAHTYTVTATSTDGLTGTTSISYTVTAPLVSIKSPRSAVTAGRARMTVACSGAVACHGTLTLTVGRTRSRVVVLAAAPYSIQNGNSKTIKLPLTRAAVTLLTEAPHHRLSVRATATLTGGRAASRAVTLTLVSPPKH